MQGIYQLWSMQHAPPGLKLEYLEIFCDTEHNSVLLDTVNHARIWWWPPFRQHVEIHTILDLADTPSGKARPDSAPLLSPQHRQSPALACKCRAVCACLLLSGTMLSWLHACCLTCMTALQQLTGLVSDARRSSFASTTMGCLSSRFYTSAGPRSARL